MTFSKLLFTTGLLIFCEVPELLVGDSFTVSGKGVPASNVGPYEVTGVYLLPEGNYSDECGLTMMVGKTFRPGVPLTVACVTPGPVQVNVFVYGAAVRRDRVFKDRFESGDAGAWSFVEGGVK